MTKGVLHDGSQSIFDAAGRRSANSGSGQGDHPAIPGVGQAEKVAFISMPRKDAPLPTVLSPAEVQRVLDGFTVAKYRMFFALIYAMGLRIREASLLETRDIDAMQQVIHVRHGKGGRDRLVPMNAKLYGLLRAYWKHERPAQPWLLTTKGGRPICHETARRALLCASAVAGIGKVVTPHCSAPSASCCWNWAGRTSRPRWG